MSTAEAVISSTADGKGERRNASVAAACAVRDTGMDIDNTTSLAILLVVMMSLRSILKLVLGPGRRGHHSPENEARDKLSLGHVSLLS